MTYIATDKIRVFVSSRLGECEAERTRSRETIESLGHQPVMFEGAGARPYPPRTVYLRGLDESQIFVGIYREGYGYVADDMKISGLEDEYRFAKSFGIPQLLYVLRDGTMEPRLRALVDEFTGPDITVGFFEEAGELADQLRNDLVALVSDYFIRGTSYARFSPKRPGVVADALVGADGRLRRERVLNELEAHLKVEPVVLVTGPLGSGKTVLLSALSDERGWAFVECGEKGPQDVLVDAANAVRSLLNLSAKAFLLIADAQAALQQAWEASQLVTLALDDLRQQETLDLVRSVAPISETHRLVISSRSVVPTAGSVYEIPPLELDETRVFIEKNREEPLMAGELVEIHDTSKGNPLYLRYYLSGQPGDYENSLAEYEAKVWRSLSTSARELLCYLAWSDRPLSLSDLSQLFSGSSSSIEEHADTIGSANSLLAESDRGYSFFHPHAKATIRNLTSRSTSHLRFYIERLSKWFYNNRDYVSAFGTLTSAGFPTSLNLLEMAGRQAAVKGDLNKAIRILELQISSAKSSSDKTHERDLTLNLAHVVGMSGKSEKALEIISRAACIEGDTDPPIDISELKATIGAVGQGDRQAFDELVAKKEDYTKDGRLWDAARVSVDLSVYYVRQKDSERAAAQAEFAMGVFKEHGDDYGYRISRGNYLSAIAELPGKETERDRLITELQKESLEEPRQRALLCNVLARRAREKSDLLDAKAYALEAIGIGRDIGDRAIICNNLINLGNSYRAEKNWQLAIAQYEAADKLAREEKLVLAEAAAQELLASVFNRKGEGERAIHHAQYAISIARGVSYKAESNATEELARAYELVDRKVDARNAWLKYASLEMEQSSDAEFGSYGFYRAVSLMKDEKDVQQYIAAYSELFGVNSVQHGDLSYGEQLIFDLPELFQKIALEWTFEVAVHHARYLFFGIPDVLVRRVYMVTIQRLFGGIGAESDAQKRLRIALALSMAVPQEILRLSDIVDVGEIVSTRHENISFRASPDGASHWTIELALGRPVIVSVIQIDDRPDVALITFCLVLVLVGFSSEVLEDVLSGIPPQRVVGSVQVCNFKEAEGMVPLAKIGLDAEPAGSAVTRATDVGADAGTPIFVITSETLTREWLPGSGEEKYGEMLFAEVLVELIFHLNSGEIEAESLYPKVAKLISRTIA